MFEECFEDDIAENDSFDSDLYSDDGEWRLFCEDGSEYDLDPEDYETEKPYKHREYSKSNIWSEIYIYCGVIFSFSPKIYFYRTNDTSMKIGDTVIALVGAERDEAEGKVVSVGEYVRVAVPYPVGKTKFILRKVGE